eukprot:582354-Rhodomonas_salina.1
MSARASELGISGTFFSTSTTCLNGSAGATLLPFLSSNAGRRPPLSAASAFRSASSAARIASRDYTRNVSTAHGAAGASADRAAQQRPGRRASARA